MGHYQFSRHGIVRQPDFELQSRPHPASQIRQTDVPAIAIDHQQQGAAFLLHPIPTMEYRRFIERLDPVDRLATLRCEPLRQQRFSRPRRAVEDRRAERPVVACRQRFGNLAVARTKDDGNRLSALARIQRKGDLRTQQRSQRLMESALLPWRTVNPRDRRASASSEIEPA